MEEEVRQLVKDLANRLLQAGEVASMTLRFQGTQLFANCLGLLKIEQSEAAMADLQAFKTQLDEQGIPPLPES